MLLEGSLLFFFALLETHLVVTDELVLEDTGFVFDAELDSGSVELKSAQFKVGVDEAWVSVEPLRSLRHEVLTEFLFETLIITHDLLLAQAWTLFLLLRMDEPEVRLGPFRGVIQWVRRLIITIAFSCLNLSRHFRNHL